MSVKNRVRFCGFPSHFGALFSVRKGSCREVIGEGVGSGVEGKVEGVIEDSEDGEEDGEISFSTVSWSMSDESVRFLSLLGLDRGVA